MANEPNSQPWWINTNKKTLDDRVKSVQDVNDPTLMSDDILRWSKIALYALLAFTTLLSGFSYFKFFVHSFGFELAICMAVLLATIIEFGKNWGFLRVLRIPFFHGWGHIWRTVPNTILWVGLLALAVVTFSASVYNSTKGAQQLSLLLGHEKNATTFSPNTADIDAQISAAEKRIAENSKIKWKGTTTVEATRAIKADTRTIETLQKQRADRMQQQRADYEKETGIKDSQNQFTAGNLMAVGGWVELLQIILSFVRVSAERSLDRTAQERRGAGNSPYSTAAGNSKPSGSPYQHMQNRTIGFRWPNYGHAAPPPSPTDVLTPQPLFPPGIENTVSQPQEAVTQHNGPASASEADDVLRYAKKQIQSWLPNFERKDARPGTVAGNIHRILNETAQKVRKQGFSPSRPVALDFYVFLQDVVYKTLNGRGHPYEFQEALRRDIYRVMPPAEPEPAA